MTDDELLAMLDDLESERVERKASLADRDRVCEAICAFANDLPNHSAPGVVMVGANDDGTPAHLAVTDALLLELSGLRENGNVYPFPSMSVEKRALRGAEMAVVTVHPSDSPPVRFRGRTWIRVGPRRAIATPEEERRLAEKRRGAALPFDAQPVPTASLDDLDLDFFRREYLPSAIASDVLAENRRSVEQQLTSLRLATVDAVPTVTGVLVLGPEPTDHLGGAYVQFLRLDGIELAAPIRDAKQVRGPIPNLIRFVEETLATHISSSVAVGASGQEARYADYPHGALVQLVRNAILHRNYEATNAPVRINWFDDRIEILSSGGPYGQVTAENFGRPGVVDYRNPNLAEAMRVLGWVQRFGVGIPIARQQLSRNGNPDLEWDVKPENVLVVVRPRR